MRIYISCDHAGFELKQKLVVFLEASGYEVIDKGAYKYDEKDDYPDFISMVRDAVSEDDFARGVIIGGSGQGEAMVANRAPNVRSGVYYGGNLDVVRLLREHNNANILSLGARLMNEEEAKKAIEIFLETKFSDDDRHIRRLAKF